MIFVILVVVLISSLSAAVSVWPIAVAGVITLAYGHIIKGDGELNLRWG
jgi:hypothetical protein